MALRNLFPESIFGRKLNPNAERRLRLSQARAEETIIRGHVDNALMFVDTLAEDLSFDRAIDTYIRVMGIPEPLASTVATRALVHLGRDLVPFRRRMQREGEDAAAENKPRLATFGGLSSSAHRLGRFAGTASPKVGRWETWTAGSVSVCRALHL